MNRGAGHAAPVSKTFGDFKGLGVFYERGAPVSQIDPGAVRKRHRGTLLIKKNQSGNAVPVSETARQEPLYLL